MTDARSFLPCSSDGNAWLRGLRAPHYWRSSALPHRLAPSVRERSPLVQGPRRVSRHCMAPVYSDAAEHYRGMQTVCEPEHDPFERASVVHRAAPHIESFAHVCAQKQLPDESHMLQYPFGHDPSPEQPVYGPHVLVLQTYGPTGFELLFNNGEQKPSVHSAPVVHRQALTPPVP